jgi:hypothetical protein
MLLFLALTALVPAPAMAGTSAELELVEKYAPIAMLKVNDDLPCSREGEQYRPSPVDVVLGNPSIDLYREASRRGQKDEVVRSAPTAQDVAGLGPNYYLDLPGSPEAPGCTYARDFQRLGQGQPAVTYAHIGREAGVQGLVVQYWFYYYFNQFNDQHESDWEMIQLAFHADTAEEALVTGPYLVAYAQHGGGEKHGWGSSEVQKQGTRPLVYVASGSHASQFDSALYLGTGENGSGLGCDDTTGPSTALPLEPILVPTLPSADASSAWLTYEGLWGETARGFNNGITGPNMKRQWREPFRWMADLRTSTPTVPGANTLGPSVTGFFCGAVASVSGFLTTASRTPLTALVIILAVVLAIAVPARRTRWDIPPLLPLRQRRAGGQIFRSSSLLYRAYWRPLALIGLVGLPLGAISVGFQWLALDLTGLNEWLEDANQDWLDPLVAAGIGGVGRAISYALVAAAVIAALAELDRGRPIGFRAAWRGTAARLGSLIAAQLAVALVTWVLAFTIVGIPVAIWLGVRWTFVQHEIIFNGTSWRDAFRASSGLVAGRWWRTAIVAAFIFLIGVAAGPVAGVILIFLTDAPLSTVNAFGSLVFALLIPYMAIARTLLFFDLEAQRDGLALPPAPDRLAVEAARGAIEPLPAEALARARSVTRRSPLVQWLLTLVTGGLWAAVWTYRANRELRDFSRSVDRPVDVPAGLLATLAALRTLGVVTGVLAAAFSAVNVRTVERWLPPAPRETSIWLAALACPVFFLDVYYLQHQLNRLAERIGPSPASAENAEPPPSSPA